jgi:DNA replication factor GINS
MNLDELRTVQSSERQSDRLQHLRDDFYPEVGEYVRELKARREKVAAEADDPYGDPEVRQLTDEIETATTVVEAIWEARIGKLVKQASLAATDMGTAEDAVEGLTAEERALFEEVVTAIEANNAKIQTALEDETPPTAEASEPTQNESSAAGSEAADSTGERSKRAPSAADADPAPASPPPETPPADDGATTTAAAEAAAPPGADTATAATDEEGTETTVTEDDAATDTDRATVQITKDIGDIVGIDDREYHLEADDVATLPTQNAEPLVERDAARRLD